jgi:2-polyprenyl-6-methoxyphenol hydroxylase-like FAD-dependent oxidoreductase
MSFRRVLMERAFLACAENLPSLTLRFGERALDLIVDRGRHPCIRGVRTTAATLPASLVIDASGIRTKILGEFSPPCVSLRSQLYYTSQPFRLTEQGFMSAADSGVLVFDPPSDAVSHVRMFLHDPPYVSLLVILPAEGSPPDQGAIAEAYRSLLSANRLQRYFQDAIALAPVQTIGFLRSRIRLLDTQASVGIDGIHQIGDALAAVDPLTSSGATMGFLQAEKLANAISHDISDYAGQHEALLQAYHEWIVPQWADGVIRGRYLQPELELPQQVAEFIDKAQYRWDWMNSIPAASPEQATVIPEPVELAFEIGQLRTPRTVIDTLV